MIAITTKGKIKIVSLDLSDITIRADFLTYDRCFSRYALETDSICFERVCNRVCTEYGVTIKELLK